MNDPQHVEVHLWGVRGSVPTPGVGTTRVGGNTSCIEVRYGDRVIVLDGGTGLVPLGRDLARRGCLDVTLLFSHLHWDHIQGVPYFAPAYLPGAHLRVLGPRPREGSFAECFRAQLSPPHHPVPFDRLPACLDVEDLPASGRRSLGQGVEVTWATLDHPGGVLGYRVEVDGRAIVYATDHEHFATTDPRLLELARGADVLICDAMYDEATYLGAGQRAPRVGWGHSTWEATTRVAGEAAVGRLVLHHHDPERDDDALDGIEAEARARFAGTILGREGLRLTL